VVPIAGKEQPEALDFLAKNILNGEAVRFSPARLRRLTTDNCFHWGSEPIFFMSGSRVAPTDARSLARLHLQRIGERIDKELSAARRTTRCGPTWGNAGSGLRKRSKPTTPRTNRRDRTGSFRIFHFSLKTTNGRAEDGTRGGTQGRGRQGVAERGRVRQ
jgi:hypothetical protein